jgi:hypothetical protein
MKYLMTFESLMNERTSFGEYKVGDTIVSDGWQPYTGGNVSPEKGQTYELVQQPLEFYNYIRKDLYTNSVEEYIDEENFIIDAMKDTFLETPPIPETEDGLHRIIAAKELGYKTILMWKKI